MTVDLSAFYEHVEHEDLIQLAMGLGFPELLLYSNKPRRLKSCAVHSELGTNGVCLIPVRFLTKRRVRLQLLVWLRM